MKERVVKTIDGRKLVRNYVTGEEEVFYLVDALPNFKKDCSIEGGVPNFKSIHEKVEEAMTNSFYRGFIMGVYAERLDRSRIINKKGYTPKNAWGKVHKKSKAYRGRF